MPRLIRPPGQAPEVVIASEVMGNSARTEVLRMLSLDGPLTTSEVARRLDTDRRGAHRHLGWLRDHGFVTADEIDNRGTIHWRVVPEQLPTAPTAWLRYVSGK